jgi:hypothetical protein
MPVLFQSGTSKTLYMYTWNRVVERSRFGFLVLGYNFFGSTVLEPYLAELVETTNLEQESDQML